MYKFFMFYIDEMDISDHRNCFIWDLNLNGNVSKERETFGYILIDVDHSEGQCYVYCDLNWISGKGCLVYI
jgi:hypothetical protein